MGRRSKAARAAKAKRQSAAREARNRNWLRHWPYLAFGGVVVGLVAALFLVGIGGSPSASEVEASYPVGYTPPAVGADSAPVEMVMWGDFQCPFCRRFDLVTLPALMDRYGATGELRVVWRNFENYGLESHDAAVAAHCAGEQDDFWEYHRTLYENQRGVNTGAFGTSSLQRYADEVGLDRAAFDTCLAGTGYDAVISADKKLGRSQGVSGTPTFFINGEKIVGAQPTETFGILIETTLSEIEQSQD